MKERTDDHRRCNCWRIRPPSCRYRTSARGPCRGRTPGRRPVHLGLGSFIVGSVALGLGLVGVVPAGVLGAPLAIILAATALGLLMATIWCAALGQSAVAAVFGIFGTFWLSYAVLVLGLDHNWFAIAPTAVLATVKLFLVTWLIIIVMLTLATLRLPSAFTCGLRARRPRPAAAAARLRRGVRGGRALQRPAQGRRLRGAGIRRARASTSSSVPPPQAPAASRSHSASPYSIDPPSPGTGPVTGQRRGAARRRASAEFRPSRFSALKSSISTASNKSIAASHRLLVLDVVHQRGCDLVGYLRQADAKRTASQFRRFLDQVRQGGPRRRDICLGMKYYVVGQWWPR